MSFNQSVIEEFRANGGRVGGMFEGGDLLLLTTTGARSGREHTVPLGYVRHDGGALLVIGSAGGSDQHPAWYHNVLAHPMVSVEVGTEQFGAVAVPAEGARRDELFAYVVERVPGYGDYQAGTSRTLPVVVLERSEPDEPVPVANLADKLIEVHTWLRSQLKHVRSEAGAYFAGRVPGAAPGLGLQLRQHCLAFCQSLEFHHTSEDAHMMPALAASHPHLAPAIDRLREEHKTVARLQSSLAALLGTIAEASPAAFLSELDELATELTLHLDYEEEQLLPVLAEIPFPPR
ncbi:nitroreductase/quinone reductase family protein [Longispora albida]|uniref:nitroreductase/quinone reductase family protein n=1 Tax=Longispora albida TaxID=203523 RepID=UPI0003611741|nr:nitroreductase/quinone reductase family protein [Longispora albida]